MVNKKGWIRIVEASVAAIIIFIVLLSVYQVRQSTFERDLSESINPLLDEIAKNVTLREAVIGNTLTGGNSEAENMLRQFVGARLNDPNIGYDVKISDVDVVVGLDPYPRDIQGNLYAGSRIISSALSTGGNPKKVNIFLWVKQ
jgi:hypothetical protein